jgi:hypothetical protein
LAQNMLCNKPKLGSLFFSFVFLFFLYVFIENICIFTQRILIDFMRIQKQIVPEQTNLAVDKHKQSNEANDTSALVS